MNDSWKTNDFTQRKKTFLPFVQIYLAGNYKISFMDLSVILPSRSLGMGVEGDTWGTSAEIQLRDHGGSDITVVVEVPKEKTVSSLVKELWTLGTVLVRAQKEMRNILICCNRNQLTLLVEHCNSILRPPETIHDQVKAPPLITDIIWFTFC